MDKREEIKKRKKEKEESIERLENSEISSSHPPLIDWCIHKHSLAVILKTNRISVWSFTSICILPKEK